MSYAPFEKLERIEHINTLNLSKIFSNSKAVLPNNEYAVLWYGKIIPNNHNLLVKVYFVNLSSPREFYIQLDIPLEAIPKMPIGSIWTNGKSKEKIKFESIVSMLRQLEYEQSISNNIDYFHIKDTADSASLLFNTLRRYFPITQQDGIPTFQDSNTLLIVRDNENNKKIIIHPLMFFNAHYGVSKEINRVLLSYIWGNTQNIDTVENLLGLTHPTQNNTAVYIPENLVLGDAVFLYHLKHDFYTKKLVKELNARVRSSLINSKYTYLKVYPYYTQPIHIRFNYIPIGKDFLLCTEITGISMPIGEPIPYEISKSTSNKPTSLNGQGEGSGIQTVKPVFQNLTLDEIFLVNDRPNNKNGAIVKQEVQTIGEVRKLIRLSNENNINEAIKKGEPVSIVEPSPNNYGSGTRTGSGGDIGLLKVIVEDQDNYQLDEYGIMKIDTQYEKLLKYAQYLKKSNKYISIDGYTLTNGKQGEVVCPIKITKDNQGFPYSIYILRIQIDDKAYYFLDCEQVGSSASSGTVVKIDTDYEWRFLEKESQIKLNLFNLVKNIAENRGRLTGEIMDFLNNKMPIVARYKHMNEDGSNWVASGINKLN